MKNPFDRKPKPAPDDVRVDLPDDHWVIFHAEILHGTVKAVADLSRRYLKTPEGAPTIAVGPEGVKATLKGDLEIDVTEIDWAGITDAIILHQAVRWSFGDEITGGFLDKIPERIHTALDAEVNRLWGGADSGPLPATGDGN